MPNTTEKPPAATHSDTQKRTAILLRWLKARAAKSDGVLPPFKNAHAAHAMDMDDMRRFGKVHGNIQSRIDFACYLSGLPPLGCAAEAPFKKAWAHEDRDWAYSVDDMQAAAQGRAWLASDFDRVLRETEHLPGQAHLSWKRAMATDEAKVKAWALGFASRIEPGQDAIDDLGSDKPSIITGPAIRYARNNRIRKEVEKRSKGCCELCDKSGFQRANGTKYIETHHIIALANDGKDRMSNVIGLCPEHHREAHYGARQEELEREMIARVKALGK